VASDPLNFFSPFERLPPNHENQLTRALLVVLRLSPAVHAVWLRLVAPDRQLQQLPVASFATQRRMLRKASADVESADLISVFLAPEEPLSGGGIVTESDRGQVLDAIIDYGGELLVVVENKIAEAEATQALLLNTTGARVLIGGEEVVVVLWRDLLDAFIALRERGLVGGTEDTVLDDFLTYVEDHFAALGPFRTLRLCHGNEFRQSRRLRQILGEATGREASVSVYGPYIVATPARSSGPMPTCESEVTGASSFRCIPPTRSRKRVISTRSRPRWKDYAVFARGRGGKPCPTSTSATLNVVTAGRAIKPNSTTTSTSGFIGSAARAK